MTGSFFVEINQLHEVAIIEFFHQYPDSKRATFKGIFSNDVGEAFFGRTFVDILEVLRWVFFEKFFHDEFRLGFAVIGFCTFKIELNHRIKALHQFFGTARLDSSSEIVNNFTLSIGLVGEDNAKNDKCT